jgi:hypothetical protein
MLLAVGPVTNIFHLYLGKIALSFFSKDLLQHYKQYQ